MQKINNYKNIFNEYNIDINKKQQEEIDVFYNILIEENNKYNLTKITDYDSFMIKHVLDSLLPINLMRENKKLVDIGSGAGFPSVIFSIFRKDLKITAIDSINKKVNFLKKIKEEINLENFNALHCRVEDFAKTEREKIDIVTGRAVAPLNIFLEYSIPLIRENGVVVVYKSQNLNEELKESQNAFKELNCYVEKINEYNITLNGEKLKRYIVIIKKHSKTKKIYPRKNNKPRITPL